MQSSKKIFFKITYINVHVNFIILVTRIVKNLPAVQETQVQSLCREDPLEKGMKTQPQYFCLENSMDRGSWWVTVHGGHKESDTTERLTQYNIL